MSGLFALPSRGPGGTWVCNVLPACGDIAVWQANVEDLPTCTSCEEPATAAAQQQATLLAQADQHAQVILDVEAAIRARRDAGEDPRATAEESANYLIAHNSLAPLMHEANRIGRRNARLSEPHTHPVFACEAHQHLLAGR